MQPKDAENMANNVDPDQEQSDLGLHYLPQACLSENVGLLGYGTTLLSSDLTGKRTIACSKTWARVSRVKFCGLFRSCK